MRVLSEKWQRNLAAMWTGQTMLMAAFSLSFPFLPLYFQTLGVEDPTAAAQWAASTTTVACLTMAVVQPIWGALADRWGRKPMVIRSMLGASLVMTLLGLARSPVDVLAIRFLQGLVSGITGASNALVGSSAPRARSGFALGVMQMSIFFGSSFGPLIGGIIADRLGFRSGFFFSGALGLTGTAIVICCVREDFARPKPDSPKPNVWVDSRSLLGIYLLPALLAVSFLIQFGQHTLGPILSLFVAELSERQNAATSAGIVMASTGAASAISALVIGRLGDRVGHSVVLPICLLGSALFYFPQAFVQQVWQLILLRMAMGMFLGGLMPSANALMAGMVAVERRGTAFGLLATMSALADAFAPLSAAAVMTFWGMRAVFLATGLVFTAAFVWVTVAFRRHSLRHIKPEAMSLLLDSRNREKPNHGKGDQDLH